MNKIFHKKTKKKKKKKKFDISQLPSANNGAFTVEDLNIHLQASKNCSINNLHMTNLPGWPGAIPTVLVMMRERLKFLGGFSKLGIFNMNQINQNKNFDECYLQAYNIMNFFRELPVKLLAPVPTSTIAKGSSSREIPVVVEELLEPYKSTTVYLWDSLAKVSMEQGSQMSVKELASIFTEICFNKSSKKEKNKMKKALFRRGISWRIALRTNQNLGMPEGRSENISINSYKLDGESSESEDESEDDNNMNNGYNNYNNRQQQPPMQNMYNNNMSQQQMQYGMNPMQMQQMQMQNQQQMMPMQMQQQMNMQQQQYYNNNNNNNNNNDDDDESSDDEDNDDNDDDEDVVQVDELKKTVKQKDDDAWVDPENRHIAEDFGVDVDSFTAALRAKRQETDTSFITRASTMKNKERVTSPKGGNGVEAPMKAPPKRGAGKSSAIRRKSQQKRRSKQFIPKKYALAAMEELESNKNKNKKQKQQKPKQKSKPMPPGPPPNGNKPMPRGPPPNGYNPYQSNQNMMNGHGGNMPMQQQQQHQQQQNYYQNNGNPNMMNGGYNNNNRRMPKNKLGQKPALPAIFSGRQLPTNDRNNKPKPFNTGRNNNDDDSDSESSSSEDDDNDDNNNGGNDDYGMVMKAPPSNFAMHAQKGFKQRQQQKMGKRLSLVNTGRMDYDKPAANEPRKSVFEESSSDEDEDDGFDAPGGGMTAPPKKFIHKNAKGKRLTVDIGKNVQNPNIRASVQGLGYSGN